MTKVTVNYFKQYNDGQSLHITVEAEEGYTAGYQVATVLKEESLKWAAPEPTTNVPQQPVLATSKP